MRTLLLHHLLRRAAERSPDATAVVDGDAGVSYGALDAWSNAIARALVAHGVRPGDRVGLLLDKSKEAIACIYGVSKAGAAYVPFDVASPPPRLGYVARDADLRVVCTSAARTPLLRDLVEAGAPIRAAITVDGTDDQRVPGVVVVGEQEIGATSREPFEARRIAEDLAYVLYTSGSTGKPKGVMLSHRAALAFVGWAVDAVRVTGDDRLSSHAPLHFDLSVFDLFASAAAAAPVVLVPPGTSRFPVEVRRLIDRERISVWYSVPSILSMLARRGGLEPGMLPSLRTILFAGEVFPTKHLRELMRRLPHVECWNLYGPTETNVCTAYRVPRLDAEDDAPVPIGRAIAGDETFVVTEDGRLAAPGEVGVLHVRGATVMSGYWNDPERTAAVLTPSRYHAPLTDLAYRTGDLVRELPDGNYEFLGRCDLQVKSRGYRVELGEIETALHAQPPVVEAAVVAVPDELVGNRIHAFAAVREEVDARELLDACRSRLPAYMVPERLDLLDALPKTSTGKVDRRALARAAAERWAPTARGTAP